MTSLRILPRKSVRVPPQFIIQRAVCALQEAQRAAQLSQFFLRTCWNLDFRINHFLVTSSS